VEDLLADPLERFLKDHCPSAAVRRFERGESTSRLWQGIDASGYADALVPESAGGAGLRFADIFSSVRLLGRYALPLPLAETMVARALLARAGVTVPSGPIVMSVPLSVPSGWVATAVPLARTAEFSLVETKDGGLVLTSLSGAEIVGTGVPGSLAADIRWQQEPEAVALIAPAPARLREIGAALRAAEMAGAMERLLEMTVDYANTREQFGRSIAKFQAIQQQLAVMAEHVLGVCMAAQMAFDEPGVLPRPLLAAVAKQRASEAVPRVAAIAHAVHGAIGLSEEYDLQLFVRRLYEWRLNCGSEAYWSLRLGEARLAKSGHSVDFVREQLGPSEDCPRRDVSDHGI
jgi:acyl-CoA dehydrogenase